MRYNIRFRFDISISKDQKDFGLKKTRKNPIGQTIEYNGSLDEIKNKINESLDSFSEQLLNIHYDKETD